MTAYRSKAEANFAKDLEQRGIEYEYEQETWYYERRISSGHCPACGSTDTYQRQKYTPDFVLRSAPYDGVVIEVKGRLVSRDRTKLIAVRKANPEKDLRVLFLCNNTLDKHNKMRYSEWAEKFGIPYAIGTHLPRNESSWRGGPFGKGSA